MLRIITCTVTAILGSAITSWLVFYILTIFLEPPARGINLWLVSIISLITLISPIFIQQMIVTFIKSNFYRSIIVRNWSTVYAYGAMLTIYLISFRDYMGKFRISIETDGAPYMFLFLFIGATTFALITNAIILFVYYKIKRQSSYIAELIQSLVLGIIGVHVSFWIFGIIFGPA